MHHDDAVSLALKIELSSISGSGFGGLPTFGSRSISTVIRLKDGETNMLAGLIRDEERKSFATIPGLGDIPVIGRLFGYNRTETTETDIILTLTPRIVRVLNLTAEDLQPFRVPRDGGLPGGDVMPPLPIPLPLPKPPGDEQPMSPALAPTAPTGPTGPVTPLKPPPVKPPTGATGPMA
jgi:general secretion pathway protein D